jgi:ABC-2 type transport system permease protein
MSASTAGLGKILQVAWREFASTVLTKGFIIGALLTPVLIVAMIGLVALLAATRKPPTVTGEVAVIDPTGRVAPLLAEALTPEAILARQKADQERIAENLKRLAGAGTLPGSVPAGSGSVPTLRTTTLPADADIEAEKQRIRAEVEDSDGRIGLVIVHADALLPQPPAEREGAEPRRDLELFVRPDLDDEVSEDIRSIAIDIIRAERFRIAGIDRAEIDRLDRVAAGRTTELTDDGGERSSLGELRAFIAYGFMMLMLIPTFVGAQYLLTSTVEEKSSRVVEILLSAVSPMQLMTGKVLGQMVVGLVILVMYGGMSAASLLYFGYGDTLSPLTLGSMIVFFALAYFAFASFMAAVGSSVNELREAQSLLGPVMIPLIIPYGLGFIIADDPNSTFATVASFVPPICPFMMMLRVASTEPPPLWQIGLGVLISAATCYASVWFAAKVFRVGLLMYGKPPNFRTLIKWVRMA